MDLDWCLSCDKHLDSPGLYCSPACGMPNDDDDDDDAARSDRIAAWAANVPVGAPPDAAECSAASRPPPRLVPERRPIPPSLSMSRPTQHQVAALSHYPDLASPATESSVATPPVIANPHKPSVLSTLASQVRSLVAPPKTYHHHITFRPSSYSSQDSFQVGDDTDDLWWVTPDPDPTLKKSSAQAITKVRDKSFEHNYFQPKHLPIPPSHSSQRRHPAYRHRGRKFSNALS